MRYMAQHFANRCIWIGLITIAFSTAAYPAYLNAPTWDVWVVDQAGHPLAGIKVSESYQDYSCESESHTEVLVTDEQGHVQFQAKYLKRDLKTCLHETASNLDAGVHASLGRHADVSVGFQCTADKRGYCIDWTGSPKQMTTKMTLQPLSPSEEKLQREIEEWRRQHSAPTPPSNP